MAQMRTSIYKTLLIRDNLELWFTSERLILLLPLVLPFKADYDRSRLNDAKGLI